MYLFRCGVFVCTLLVLFGCGSALNNSGSSSGNASINLTIQNPDPDATGKAAKAVIGSPSTDVSVSKSDSSASLSSCTLAVSGSGMSSISQTANVAANATSVTFEVSSITAGSARAFSVDCVDSAKTSNNINFGFTAQTSADVGSSGTTSISMSGKFLNLITDTTGDSGVDIQYVKGTQTSSSNTRFTIGFGNTLSDSDKNGLVCYVDFNASGVSGTNGMVDTNRSDGGVCGIKKETYLKVAGGLSKPACNLHNSSDTKLMVATGAWGTTDAGNTALTCDFSVTHMKRKIDDDQNGNWCALCIIGSSKDATPANSSAKFDFSGHTDISEVSSLVSANLSCSGDGECDSGECTSLSLCRSVSAWSLTGVVSDYAGPPAGTTAAGSTDAVGTAARFTNPNGVCTSPDGSQLFVGDSGNHIIRQVTISSANVVTLAGTASSTGTTDATGASARFNTPKGCVVDPTGTNLYVADTNNHTIRKIVIATGVVTTFAGVAGSSGTTNGDRTIAQFNQPNSVVLDRVGAVMYITDTLNNLIRKIIMSDGTVSTFAGSGTQSSVDGTGTAATFNRPRYLAIDSTDTNLYVTDSGHLVRQIVIATQKVTTIAGSGTASSTDGTGTSASFNTPRGIAIDPTDSYLYITDNGGHTLRKIEIATGIVTTLAGSGTAGDTNGTGTAAAISTPWDVVLDPNGTTLYMVESGFDKVRKVQ